MADGNVTVTITGDAASLKRALGESQSALSSFASQAQKIGDRATSIGRSMSIGVTAPLIGLGKVAFDELQQAAQASAQTEAAIKSTGGAAHVTAKQVDEMSASLLQKTGIDDEVIKGGENVLLTFRAIRNEAGKGNDIFNQATRATLDLSVAFGKDMTSSAILVGKALQDPIQGIGALQRVGVQFTAAQREQIKALVESGDVMGAQKVILQELRTEVGGSADAYGKSMAGQVSRATEEMKNAGAAVLASFAPAIKTVADFALAAAQGLASLPGPLQSIIVGGVGVVAAIGPLTYVFGAISKGVSGAISVFQALSSAAETLALKGMYLGQGIANVVTQLGPVGLLGIAGGVGIAIAGMAGAFDEAGTSIEEVTSKLQHMSQVEMENYIQKMITAGKFIGDVNILHQQFSGILQQDTTVAQQYITTLQGMGINTDYYEKKLAAEIARQQQANAERDAAKQKVDALGQSVNNLPAGKHIPITSNVGDILGGVYALGDAINGLPRNTTITVTAQKAGDAWRYLTGG